MLRTTRDIPNPFHAIKLADGQSVVSNDFCDADLHRVCLADAAGKPKKSFGGQRGSAITQLNSPQYLVVDGNG